MKIVYEVNADTLTTIGHIGCGPATYGVAYGGTTVVNLVDDKYSQFTTGAFFNGDNIQLNNVKLPLSYKTYVTIHGEGITIYLQSGSFYYSIKVYNRNNLPELEYHDGQVNLTGKKLIAVSETSMLDLNKFVLEIVNGDGEKLILGFQGSGSTGQAILQYASPSDSPSSDMYNGPNLVYNLNPDLITLTSIDDIINSKLSGVNSEIVAMQTTIATISDGVSSAYISR